VKKARVLVVAALAAVVGVSAARQPHPPVGRVYLDDALSLIRTKAVAAPALNWSEVVARAHEMTGEASEPEDAYAAIRYALDQLRRAGDGHATFYPAAVPRGSLPPRNPPLPTVGRVRGRLGEVTLTAFLRPFGSPWGRRYLRTVLSGIAALEQHDPPCGWIVNLAGDYGGNGWAMVLSVGPIIGEGRFAGFTGRRGFLGWASYYEGAVSGLGSSLRAPIAVPTITPAPPVAVLTSEQTASGGELATVAFRGRPQTRSFGTTTYGATNGPALFRLSDGAELVFGINYFVDRRGIVYRHAIAPTVVTRQQEAAAARWLLSTPPCTSASRGD
jgi:carboxyl-terminal processing protease